MKKLLCAVVLTMGISLLAVPPSYGDRDWDRDKDGCKNGDLGKGDCDKDRDRDKRSVPEPGSLGLLSAGIVVVSGMVLILSRKRRLSN